MRGDLVDAVVLVLATATLAEVLEGVRDPDVAVRDVADDEVSKSLRFAS